MIQPTASVHPGFFLNVIRLENMGGGRLTVPVHPTHAPYARFKHIQGVPAHDDGVPIFRLRVLDNLIDRLISRGQQIPSPAQLLELKPESIDPLIDRLESRLHRYLLQFPSSFGGLYPETGLLIDLSA